MLYQYHPYAILLMHDKHLFTFRGRTPTWETQEHSVSVTMLSSDCSTRVLSALPTWAKMNSAKKDMSSSKSSISLFPRQQPESRFLRMPNSSKNSSAATLLKYRISVSLQSKAISRVLDTL